MLLFEPTENVLNCSRDIEIELLESNFLIFLGVIIRVENGCDIFGFLRFLHGLNIV